MNKNSFVVYEIEGLNFKKFLLKLQSENIEVLTLNRIDYNKYIIKICLDKRSKLETILKRFNYKFNIKKTSRVLTFFTLFKRNLALFLCGFILLIATGFLNCFVLKVEVLGLEKLTSKQVVDVLTSNGVNCGKIKNKYNMDEIELLIKNSLEQVSLVSCIIRGNTLVVNINEKIDNSSIEGNFEPITAPFDMVVKDIRLKSGTSAVEKNSTVKKGEAIVLPFIEYKDGTKLEVVAQAEIDAYIEISNTIYYMENHQEFVKSGRLIKQSEYSLFNFSWKGINNKNNFKEYEEQIIEEYVFKNMFLPIKKTTKVFYELVSKQVFVPFDKKQEEKLICENESLLYNELCSETNITDCEYLSTTKYVDNMYLVTTYLKANVSLHF